ncbi:hypothetical protein LJF28_04785 [Chryseobacterium indologenes]|uniref:hypothetical protein n=1 Tax=Chryseobacterium indologenes TaxID=253 RepID=UPI001D0D04BE|nr:hypothetical protein [Chryseobacterium indologenes]UDQ54985.1 hypothetical protein LJF28_04785 [Chryseobacterium indologenes]
MKITVLHNQSILDIAVQYTGKAENAFDIAMINGISVSDSLVSGQIIEIPETNIDNDMVSFLKRKNVKPATAVNTNLIEIRPLAGIGYWEIENEFIIG